MPSSRSRPIAASRSRSSRSRVWSIAPSLADLPVLSERRANTLGASLTTVSERRQLEPRRMAVALRGELDWVVMKCLEKDRSRRYQSPAELAADVARYLAG